MSPEQSVAHYQIVSKLGEGGMGEVWRATDTKLNRGVALKVLPASFAADPDRVARFQREAQVLASLNHPGIAAIYGVEDRALVMELVEGPTLAERIAAGPIPLDEALPIAKQTAEALEYAHERGIVHRDLKPANVKITPEGSVKVLDFGLAKAVSSDTPRGDPASSPTLTMRATQSGLILGTAGYMAPEQARGQSVDRRADIWAFGVVLYEMLSGRTLFTGPTISDTLAAVLKTEPDLSTIAPEVRPIVEGCLRKDTRRRWQSIGDVRLLLEECISGNVGQAGPEGAPRANTARNVAIAAAAVMALALTAVSTIHFRETPPAPAMVRFQLSPPEGGSFGLYMALSPDGRRLTFTANVKGGPMLLWIRELDSLGAHSLPGTEGAAFPFWSPDSRFLAYSSGGKLRKIDISGGSPQTLCDISSSLLGGYWNSDGMIFFGDTLNGIFRVPQAGGDPVALTHTDQGEIGHRFPQFLPDGSHYLYLAVMSGRYNSIYLASLDNKEKKRVALSTHNFSYAPPSENGGPGHLLLVRDNNLIAQPVYPKTLALAGDAFPIAEGLQTVRNRALFAISGNALVYRTGEVANQQLTWLDRAGKPLGTVSGRAYYDAVALSRNGARLAVTKLDSQTRTDMWLIDVADGTPTRFTFDQNLGARVSPVWSPDGSRIAFSSVRDGHPNVFVKDSAGGAQELLQKSDRIEHPCDWSPDGKFLMYTRRSGGAYSSAAALWTISDPAGDPASRKSGAYLEMPFSTSECQFSPDGHWVAYRSEEFKQSEIYVQSFPAPSSKFQISPHGGAQPRWRRDGKELFYLAADGELMAVDVKLTPAFQAGIPHPLFDARLFGAASNPPVFHFEVAPDGQRFLVSAATESEGTAPEPITVVLNWTAGLRK